MRKIAIIFILAVCSTLAYGQADSVSLGYGVTLSKMASAVSADAVSQEQLLYTESDNSLNSLFGLVPGLYVSQGGSLPWSNSPGLTVRGSGSFNGGSTLVLVDGIERDASLVNPNEIERITVLRDAAATALYGNRAANGVILIQTKRGTAKKTQVKVGYNFGLCTPFRIAQMANAYDYALAVNEALENDGLKPRFDAASLKAIQGGGNNILVSNDWQSMILKDTGHSHEFNLSVDGAKDKVKYYIFLDFDSYRGIFADTKINDGYSTQVESSALKGRANIDGQLTKTTVVKFNFMGRLHQYQQPNQGCSLASMYTTPALSFPVMYKEKYVVTSMFSNPYQDKVGFGYSTSLGRSLYADFAVDQDLKFITPGLRLTAVISYDNDATIHDSRPYSDIVYRMDYGFTPSGKINSSTFTEYGNYSGNGFGTYLGSQYMTFTNYEKLSYERDFGAHHIDAAGIFSVMQQRFTGANNVYLYQDNILNANYGYAGKYFLSATANYSGSAKLASGDKYRLYPAVSAAWLISGEDFMKDSGFDFLKLRASWGIVGSDRSLSYDMDQQYNGGGGSYIFINKSAIGGLREGDLPATQLDPEQDMKANIGLEGKLGGKLSFQLEGFYNDRTCIRVSSTGAFSDALGIGVTDICTGHATNMGGELMLAWDDRIGDLEYHVGGNIAYTKSKVIYKAEEYHPYDWMYYEGHAIGAFYGLTSDGFYQESDFDAEGNLVPGVPVSSYIDAKPGDVKYKDLNEDGIIDAYDFKYFDFNGMPDFIYGIQLGLKYKNFGMEAMFDGAFGAKTGLTLSSIYRPLYNNDKNISQFALENHWSKDNTDAAFPRLTTLSNNNNFAESDIWWTDWNYFKLRNVYVWYDLKDIRLFLRGNNLFSADSIKILDPQAINMDYPSMRSFQAGVKYRF